ncbi:MAG: flagellar biosynthetic protein FliO [Treponema sp.]|nr:flagellar biosynthetic protein FliO [Treponema sp.]
MHLGGEELKKSLIAPLLLGVWFLVQISPVSSQEEPSEELDPLAAAERALTFEESAVSSENPAPVREPSVWVVIRMLLTLTLAAAAIYGVVYFFKRKAKPSAVSDPFLKILATAHLGSNRYAHVVSVGTKAWLLGSSDGGVNLIGEVEDKDVLNAMLLEDSTKSAQGGGRFPDFSSILRRFGIQAESRAPSADDIRKRRERLKGL